LVLILITDTSQDEEDDDFEHLSDSDEEDEAAEMSDNILPAAIQMTTTTSNNSPLSPHTGTARRSSTTGDNPQLSNEEIPPNPTEGGMSQEPEGMITETHEGDTSGAGIGDVTIEEEMPDEVRAKKDYPVVMRTPSEGQVMGPKKTKVVIRDAAWSTWWAVLYWVGRVHTAHDNTSHLIRAKPHPALYRYNLLRPSFILIYHLLLVPLSLP